MLTFVDAGVLIDAARGTPPRWRRAMAVIDDPNRTFVSSAVVKLEVLPKPLYEKQRTEAEIYTAFFDKVSMWVSVTPELVDRAFDEATKFGLKAADALHVVAADIAGADELVTTEGTSKPIHRTTSVRVRTLLPD